MVRQAWFQARGAADRGNGQRSHRGNILGRCRAYRAGAQDLRARRVIAMAERITIRKPDDWHLHVRDGAMLRASLPFTAANFGRAILMPNLLPPVLTVKDAIGYRERVMAALPEGSTFQPLLTCYLTDSTDPDDVET